MAEATNFDDWLQAAEAFRRELDPQFTWLAAVGIGMGPNLHEIKAYVNRLSGRAGDVPATYRGFPVVVETVDPPSVDLT